MTTLDEKARARRNGLAWHMDAVDTARKAGYLAALAEPTEAEIEAVAKELYLNNNLHKDQAGPGWVMYRGDARAAVSAFLKERADNG